MSNGRRTIEIHIVMNESGAFVVSEDASDAAEKADEEFPDEDVRQIALTIDLQPPSVAPEPATARITLD